MVLLHNGGFCNDCITKRCLYNLGNVSFISRFIKMFRFFHHVLNNIGFPMKGNFENFVIRDVAVTDSTVL
jgi:hypothetical protein